MTQQEFTDRTGLKVTEQEFVVINNIYMAAGDMDKDRFCEEYLKYGKSELVGWLASRAIEHERQKEQLQNQKKQLADFLLERAEFLGDSVLLDKAIKMIGHRNVIKRKIALELPLWDSDKEYIRDNI